MKMISDSLYDKVVRMLRIISMSCKGCLRPKEVCSSCDISGIAPIIDELCSSCEDKSYRDWRFDTILDQLRKAGRPLKSVEIDPDKKLCGRILKEWTLRRMCELGLLKVNKKDHSRYTYELGEKAK